MVGGGGRGKFEYADFTSRVIFRLRFFFWKKCGWLFLGIGGGGGEDVLGPGGGGGGGGGGALIAA